MELKSKKIAIIGCGNIGSAIATGIIKTESVKGKNIYITRRKHEALKKYKKFGINTTADNKLAVRNSEIIIIAVTPHQLDNVLTDIKDVLEEKKHIIFSVVSGVKIETIKNKISKNVPVVRVMPNTAIKISESMTCLSIHKENKRALNLAKQLFDLLGSTLIIKEELMVSATVLGACGLAFFLRAVRAASQGGIEIGFHAEEALFIAAQTAKGAASILLQNKTHPEEEVDKVTTPQGCTIAGLNEMEHHGFSSSLIKGIVTSAEKCSKLS